MTKFIALRLAVIGVGLACSIVHTGVTAEADKRAAGRATPREPLELEELGSFYVGGRTIHTDALTGDAKGGAFPPNSGDVSVDQMYVQYAIPAHSSHIPIVMIHGGVVTGANYETTPDGRMGWREYFVRKGRPVYLVDQVWRGRSGFDATILNEVRLGVRPPADLPLVVRLAHDTVWTWLRFGPALGSTYPDEQFPVEAWEQFQLGEVPNFVPPSTEPNRNLAPLAALAGRLGGAILLGHSESAFYPERTALIDAEHIRGMISLETAFCPASFAPNELAILAKIPLLVVFGDHLAEGPPEFASRWTTALEKCRAIVQQLRAAGGDAILLRLPEAGVSGNSHMMMQDKNNLQVADLIIEWVDHHAEVHSHHAKKPASVQLHPK